MAEKYSKINDQKRLIELIRKAFKEEFALKEKKKMLKLISGNFSITKQQIEEVKEELLDLRKSIELKETEIKSKQC